MAPTHELPPTFQTSEPGAAPPAGASYVWILFTAAGRANFFFGGRPAILIAPHQGFISKSAKVASQRLARPGGEFSRTRRPRGQDSARPHSMDEYAERGARPRAHRPRRPRLTRPPSHRRPQQTFKVLLLGAGESGKSTSERTPQPPPRRPRGRAQLPSPAACARRPRRPTAPLPSRICAHVTRRARVTSASRGGAQS